MRKFGWVRALLEVVGLVLGFLLFARLHAGAGKDVAAATANARALQSAERALHLNIERAANHWLAAHPFLIEFSVYCYRLYYAVLVAALVWIFLRHADVYVKVRRTLVAMTFLILPVYWAMPMSPPRFALPGIVDIVADHDLLGGHPSQAPGQNHYSAMPSLHVGWSLWCAYAAWTALRGTHPRLALAAWLFPLLMTGVVLTTGNHYVLDVVGSVILLALSIAATTAWNYLVDRVKSRRQMVPAAN